MIPAPVHFLALWQAETRKLLSRLSARIGLVVAVFIGLSIPLALLWLGSSDMAMNGTALKDSITTSAPKGLAWALTVRNFFVLQVFVIMLAALSFAGEFQARTLREDLLRPVPRWSILFAKWAALGTWIGLTLGLSWLVSAVLGLIVFGTEGSWQDPALAYLMTWVCDMGFAAVILALAVVLRSVSATIVSAFLFYVLDKFVGWGLTILSWVAQATELPGPLEFAVQARPWLPSSAFGVWQSFNGGDPWVWQNFAALAIISLGSLLVAVVFFERVDVP